AMIDHGDRQDTSHTTPLRTRAGEPKNLIIGLRNRLAHTLGGVAGFAFKSRSKHGERDIRGFSTGSLAAYAIDNQQEAAARVTIETILVDRALTARVRLPGSDKCMESSHLASVLIRNLAPNVARDDDSQSDKQQISRPEQQRHQRTRLKLK